MRYYLGLDIGTNSVGWAVTDNEFNVLKKNKKHLWGVRLFEQANTAEERRAKRTARRGRARKKLMQSWLQEIFAHEIEKVDKDFFIRLKNSMYYSDDKDCRLEGSKDSVFVFDSNGNKYTDKDYFKEYPTIYALRNELLHRPAKDVRFLYLAIYNIIKNRGHFYESGGEGENKCFDGILKDIKDICDQLENVEVTFRTDVSDKEVLNVLKNNKYKKDRKSKLIELLQCKPFKKNSDNKDKVIVESFVSGKIDVSTLFSLEEDKVSVDLSDNEKFESDISQLSSLNDEQILVLEKIKSAYDSIVLKNLIGDCNYVCEAKLSQYHKYKEELNELKQFIRKYYNNRYNEIFRTAFATNKNKINYSLYTNRLVLNGKSQKMGVEIKQSGEIVQAIYHEYETNIEALHKYLKQIIESEPSNVDEEYTSRQKALLDKIADGTLLVKLRNKTNSSIPNSLLKKELEKILETNAEKFTFLNEKDESGLTNIQKILQIMSFRVPYYVGPITSKANSKHAWAKIKNNTLQYTPWNLSKIVDYDEAENDFIRRMTNKCTYLKNEDVLPKNSIIFSKFKVLNELNKMSINGVTLTDCNEDVDLKRRIFNELFLIKPKVSVLDIKKWLVRTGKYGIESSAIEIGGIDKEFKSNMSSYIALKNILGEKINNSKMCEEIIKLHTIMQDKGRIVKRLRANYPGLSEDELKKIKALNYSGFGTLSKKFLDDICFVDKSTGETFNGINEALWHTNQNMQQILHNEMFSIKDELDKIEKENRENFVYELVESSNCSPSVKRGIWQSILIINELKKHLGNFPEKIFVETTRGDEVKGEQGRKLSRLKKLQDIYRDKKSEIQKIVGDYNELVAGLNNRQEGELREDKLYLYYLQNGKCAYSGEPLAIEDLSDCDIDHIIPRCFIKDDSINNRVLVRQKYNKIKKDIYPLPTEWIQKCAHIWKSWLNQGMISQSKYDKLIRQDELTAEDRAGFINRQLVETSQSVKGLIDILRGFVENERDIVFSKAEVVSEFRHWHDIPKCRDVNDFHHAIDAYLNIVVGNVTRAKFTDNPVNYFNKKQENGEYISPLEDNDENASQDLKKETENPLKIFNKFVYDYTTRELVWRGSRDIARIREICRHNDISVCKKTELFTENAFYKESIHKSLINNPRSEAKVGLKGKGVLANTERYGGFGDQVTAYFMIVKSQKSKSEIVSVERMTTYAYAKIKSNLMTIDKYLSNELGLKNATILKDKLPIFSELKIGDGRFLISGVTGNSLTLQSINEWHVDFEIQKYVKLLFKFCKMDKNKIKFETTEDKIIVSPAVQDKKEHAITRTDNAKLFDRIVKYLGSNLFELSTINNVAKQLLETQDKFVNLSIIDQSQFLTNIISKFARCAKIVCDLSMLGRKENVGATVINKNITGKGYKLVKRNVLGYVIYESDMEQAR